MAEIILHALPWGILGLLCLYAGSEPAPVGKRITARDVYFPDDTATEPKR
jgi:hypothetical protein